MLEEIATLTAQVSRAETERAHYLVRVMWSMLKNKTEWKETVGMTESSR